MPKLPITLKITPEDADRAIVHEAMRQLGYPDGDYHAEAHVTYKIDDYGRCVGLEVGLLNVTKR